MDVANKPLEMLWYQNEPTELAILKNATDSRTNLVTFAPVTCESGHASELSVCQLLEDWDCPHNDCAAKITAKVVNETVQRIIHSMIKGDGITGAPSTLKRLEDNVAEQRKIIELRNRLGQFLVEKAEENDDVKEVLEKRKTKHEIAKGLDVRNNRRLDNVRYCHRLFSITVLFIYVVIALKLIHDNYLVAQTDPKQPHLEF